MILFLFGCCYKTNQIGGEACLRRSAFTEVFNLIINHTMVSFSKSMTNRNIIIRKQKSFIY